MLTSAVRSAVLPRPSCAVQPGLPPLPSSLTQVSLYAWDDAGSAEKTAPLSVKLQR
jgi:hypothetical protein